MFAKVKTWFNNYWYYYKWPVIVIGAFLLIGVICFSQCAGKENYDVSVVYTGPHIFGVGEKAAMSSAIEQLMSEDYNGDGKKVVDFIDLTAFSDEQINEAIGTDKSEGTLIKYASYRIDEVKSSFVNLASKSDVMIFMVDEYWYNILYNAEYLVRLEDILGYKPEKAIDDYSIYLSDLDVYTTFGDSFGKLPQDTILCFRKEAVTSALIGRGEAEKMYSYSLDLFKRIVEFKAS